MYSPDGGFLHTIGREGEGPGEFRGGTYERSWRSACCVRSRIILDEAARIWIPVSIEAEGKAPRASHLRFTPQGDPVDTVYMPFREEGRGCTMKLMSVRRSVTLVPVITRSFPRLAADVTRKPPGR